MRTSPFFVQLGRIVVGYAAGAIAFGLFFAMSDATTGDGFVGDSVFTSIGAGAVFSGIFALPIALNLVIVSEWLCWRTWRIFVGIGTLAGGILLSTMFYGGMIKDWAGTMSLISMVAGCAASGLTYWAIAGRHAGSWRA